jgi:hypothetical protein
VESDVIARPVDSAVPDPSLPPAAIAAAELETGASAGARARSVARVSPALCGAALLVGAWLALAPRTPDFAAQYYRAWLFEHEGFSLWDSNWYAGHHLPGYSLLFGGVALILGTRAVGAIAVLASTVAFERLAVSVYGPRARWGALVFAVAAAGDLWIGRVTFALGVTFGVLAALAFARRRLLVAAALALLCAAASPVAGLLLALAGATHVMETRRTAAALALLAPPFAVVLVAQALFPEGGFEPFAFSSIAATLAVTAAFLYALPRRERLLRSGAWLYVAATLLSIVPTPMGSNVDRYAVLLAGPLVVCALARDGWRAAGRPPAAVAIAVAGIVTWTVWGPVRETIGIVGDPSTSASYYVPLERFLAAHDGARVRVEVPFTHSHWEAALLAPSVELARGWERQLDKRYDSLFGEKLTPAVYREWLRREAVSYVALPDVRMDGSSYEEAALVRSGLPFLREVMRSAHWRVFAVQDPRPLVSSPATLRALGHDSFTLSFAKAGSSIVRLRYTRYWTAIAGAGCVAQAANGWTVVTAPRPGTVSVAARFSPARALGLGGGCSR